LNTCKEGPDQGKRMRLRRRDEEGEDDVEEHREKDVDASKQRVVGTCRPIARSPSLRLWRSMNVEIANGSVV
jgi:hypothetical protein